MQELSALACAMHLLCTLYQEFVLSLAPGCIWLDTSSQLQNLCSRLFSVTYDIMVTLPVALFSGQAVLHAFEALLVMYS